MIRNLYEFFEPSIRNHADDTAIVTPDGEAITYSRLGEIVEGYAARALRAGITKNSRVTIHGVSMVHYLFLVFALSKVGAVHVRAPDPEGSGGVQADYVIVDAASKFSGPKVVAMNLAWPDASEPGTPVPKSGFDSEDDICIILGTSGSTGLRKQVGMSLRLLTQFLTNGLYDPNSRRTLLHIPPTLMLGLILTLHKLMRGLQVVMPRRTDWDTLQLLMNGQADDVVAPPVVYSSWVELLKNENIRLNTLERALIGGSISSKALLASVQEYVCKNLFIFYGSTEVGGIAFGRADEMTGLDGAVGNLVPWIDVRINDDKERELEKGQVGQLSFRLKAGLCPARYMDEKAGSEGDWFVSGDIGTLMPDGILCIRGRVNEVMNVGGNKISPALVEAAVGEFLGTTEPVAALGVPGAGGFDEAVVVVNAKFSTKLKDLPAFLDQTNFGLGRVHILAIKSFPLNEFGKVDKLKLRDMVVAEIARRRVKTGAERPAGPAETGTKQL
jgi:acyl-CoA synthetase (AMP-forming)/AMP-acid ligase II